ncbi:hypothetical protein QFC20_001894 [Naganishia adeliensis]|uniref:Uncharacterized protein n=1 Tax=Naganishia adeliensis TaxID=92952 RepID=A0ACC2WP54_9TREE|nr:Transcription initiation factor IIA subunit 2 [Naganishia albida]KAJ9113543.1 hypothetical protein QFC20_001894 [Naganishia adeliensis]
MSSQAALELYRGSALGHTLTDALDQMISEGSIDPQLAMKVLSQYDKYMSEAVQKQVKTKTTIKGHLKEYRSVDDVWNFTIKNAVMKLEGGADKHADNVMVDKIKIVACKSATAP